MHRPALLSLMHVLPLLRTMKLLEHRIVSPSSVSFNVFCGHLAMLNVHILLGSLLDLCSFNLFPCNPRSRDLIWRIVIIATVNKSVLIVHSDVVLGPGRTREYPFGRL